MKPAPDALTAALEKASARVKRPGERKLEALEFDGIAANFRMIMVLEPPKLPAYRAALQELERGLARAPGDSTLHALRGKALSNLSRFAEARAALGRAIALDAGDARARAWLGEVYLLENRIDAATLELDRALVDDPACAWARFYRAAARYVAGQGEPAVEDLRAVLAGGAAPSALAAAKAFLGLLEAKAGRHVQALCLIDSARTAGPGEAWPFVLRSVVHRARGDRPAALADLDSALAVRPAGWLHLERALIHEEAGETQSALADVDAALRLDGPSGPVLVRRGRLQIARQKLDLAAGDFERALKHGREDEVRTFGLQLGEAYLGARRRTDAVKVLALAVAHFPGDGEVLFGLAQAENRAESFTRAAAALRAALGRRDADPRLWLALAQTEVCRSRFASAARAAARAVRLVLGEGEAKTLLTAASQAKSSGKAAALLLSGLLGRSLPNSGEATTLIAAAARKSSDARVLQALGEAFEREGSPAEAATAYRRACALGPSRLTAFFHLARLLRASGDGRGAARALAAAKRRSFAEENTGLEALIDRFQLSVYVLDNEEASRIGELILDRTRRFEHLESLSVPNTHGYAGAAVSPALRRYSNRALAAAEAYARRRPDSAWACFIVNLWRPRSAGPEECRLLMALPASRYGWMRGRVGCSLLYRREFAEAIRQLSVARDFCEPRDWRCQCFIAEAHFFRGDLDGALCAFRELESWPEAPRGEIQAWKAEILLWSGRYAQALKVLDELPKGESAQYALCWKGAALCRLGRYGPALKALDESLSGAPNDLEARVWRAETLLRSGRKRAALEAADEAVSLGGGFYAHAVRGLARAAAGDDKGLRADYLRVNPPLMEAAIRLLGLPESAHNSDILPRDAARVLEKVLEMSRGIRRESLPYMVRAS